MEATDIPPILDAVTAVAKATGLFLVLPVVLYRLLKAPPAWTQRFFVTKAKMLGAEVEISRTEPSLAAAPPSATTAGQVAEPSPPAAIDVSSTNSEELSFFARAEEYFKAGSYEDGLALFREGLAAEPNRIKAAGEMAFGYYLAFRSGIASALEDLRSYTGENSSASDTHYWLAQTLAAANRKSEAIAVISRAVQLADERVTQVRTVTTLSTFLTSEKRYQEAFDLLKSNIRALTDQDSQTRLYRALAEVYESEGGASVGYAMLMYERAVSANPGDRSLRFDVAHKYGSEGANGLALHHYRKVLKRDEDDDSSANNAGIAAQALECPITGVRYLRSAADAGSTLAQANLAAAFLDAGFEAEAKRLVDEARETPNPSERVEIVAGDIARNHRAEETKLEALLKRVSEVRHLRLRLADALLADDVDPRSLVGEYVDSASKVWLILEAGADGTVIGRIRRDYGTDGVFETRIRGGAMQFTWQSEDKPGSLWLKLGAVKEGHGVLLLEPDRVSGYIATEPASLDIKRWAGYKEWDLKRRPTAGKSEPAS